jgi:hypothetical protein
VDSPAPTAPFGAKTLIPLAAVIREDFRQTLRHWAFLAWAALALAMPIYTYYFELPSPAAAAAQAPRDDDLRRFERDPRELTLPTRIGVSAAEIGAAAISRHLFMFGCLALAFGACAISAEIAVAGDSVLCWGVARWQYFLGKCLARAIAAMMLFLFTTAPMLWLFGQRADADIEFGGALVVIGVALGAWFRSVAPAVTVGVLGFAVLRFAAQWHWGHEAAWSPSMMYASLKPALLGQEFASTLPRLLCIAAAGWAAISAVRFRFVDL